MQEYVQRYGFANREQLIDYAHALVTTYGEGSAELTCQMFEAIAEMEGKIINEVLPAEIATREQTAFAINGSLKQSPSGQLIDRTVSRLVKQVGADTMVQNALKYGAEFAWVPMGDTCPFCITLASRGWQRASNKLVRNGHATHIHANCDCQFCVRFNPNTTVQGYDPEKYLNEYNEAGTESFSNNRLTTSQKRINAMAREKYAQNKEQINARKREAYAKRKQFERESTE